jgi:hypothetical protein
MYGTTLTRNERDELYAVHRALARLHSRVTKVTAAQHARNESADDALNAQLAISDALMAVSKATEVR